MYWISFFAGVAAALVVVGAVIAAYAIAVNRGDPPYEPQIKEGP